MKFRTNSQVTQSAGASKARTLTFRTGTFPPVLTWLVDFSLNNRFMLLLSITFEGL